MASTAFAIDCMSSEGFTLSLHYFYEGLSIELEAVTGQACRKWTLGGTACSMYIIGESSDGFLYGGWSERDRFVPAFSIFGERVG